ncbi:hypothetical protein U0C82_01360 [Fulvimarina sp. 2208YS6-2-32]|uniref:Uncharacterized protein n=1 Tax=Fulvimarina uroteuthidis TaxID=3098149 RepID=A0ABU5HXC7_9HYPH|nr:hypothetical protein [Fulvimarina sp. 2208YS6-2-32]MDY8107794.1 hypothetical protein [Fulvimarina sp. 2208YS6-2-32]
MLQRNIDKSLFCLLKSTKFEFRAFRCACRRRCAIEATEDPGSELHSCEWMRRLPEGGERHMENVRSIDLLMAFAALAFIGAMVAGVI